MLKIMNYCAEFKEKFLKEKKMKKIKKNGTKNIYL